jgi:hypothetical protein
LRLLDDPIAIEAEASRLLGERLLTDRACYAEIDEAQGYIRSTRLSFARASSRSDDFAVRLQLGRSGLSMGAPVVVPTHKPRR